MTKNRGIFICIEGIDGSGKTTQARSIVAALTKLGYAAVYTTEPSEGVYGRMIREHILQGENRVAPIVEAVMFAVDRLDHISKEIEPLLEQGKIVICDRYLYSSIAYQGDSDIDTKWIREINKHAIRPHLAIYIDAPPKIVIKRLKWRRKSVMETLRNQRRVRERYLELVKEKQLIMIHGASSKRKVAQAIQNIVLNYLKTC